MSRHSLQDLGFYCVAIAIGMVIAGMYGNIDNVTYMTISGVLASIGLVTTFMPKQR